MCVVFHSNSHVFMTFLSPPQIFPLFRALGANGILIEYEDVFPYEGHLRLLRAKHAYRYLRCQAGQCLCREDGMCRAATWRGGGAGIIKIKHVH